MPGRSTDRHRQVPNVGREGCGGGKSADRGWDRPARREYPTARRLKATNAGHLARSPPETLRAAVQPSYFGSERHVRREIAESQAAKACRRLREQISAPVKTCRRLREHYSALVKSRRGLREYTSALRHMLDHTGEELALQTSRSRARWSSLARLPAGADPPIAAEIALHGGSIQPPAEVPCHPPPSPTARSPSPRTWWAVQVSNL